MRRREFITLLGGATAVWPLAARAEQPERQRRVGFLRAEKPPAPWMDAFQKALRELGSWKAILYCAAGPYIMARLRRLYRLR
jgi:hypothetical protein